MRNESSASTDERLATLQKELGSLREEKARAVADLEAKFRDERRELREDHAAQLAEKLDAKTSEHDEALSKALERARAAERATAELERQASEVEELRKRRDSDARRLQGELESVDQKHSDLAKALAEARAETASLKATAARDAAAASEKSDALLREAERKADDRLAKFKAAAADALKKAQAASQASQKNLVETCATERDEAVLLRGRSLQARRLPESQVRQGARRFVPTAPGGRRGRRGAGFGACGEGPRRLWPRRLCADAALAAQTAERARETPSMKSGPSINLTRRSKDSRGDDREGLNARPRSASRPRKRASRPSPPTATRREIKRCGSSRPPEPTRKP